MVLSRLVNHWDSGLVKTFMGDGSGAGTGLTLRAENVLRRILDDLHKFEILYR